MNIFKRLYEWMLSWGNSRYGAVALLLFAIAESSFFPIPPDVLLIALCLGAQSKSFRYAAICTAGSLIGAVCGYMIGSMLWTTATGDNTALATFFFDNVFSEAAFHRVEDLYHQYDFWIIFTAGFTPIPYKIFTITAGLFDVEFVMFILASAVARGARFFLVAGLIYRFGAPIKGFIDKYFNLLAIAFTVVLIGSFALIKMVL
ncbi:MAG: YqaA family protein [Rikenellaceae bacterium]